MRRRTAAALLAGGILTAGAGAPVAAAEPSCTELGGTLDAAQLCRLHTATPEYVLDVVFPTDYADQRALTDYVVQNRDGFLSVATQPGARNLPYEMAGTAEQHRSGQLPGGTHSVVLKVFQEVGGPQPSVWYKAFNYDLTRRQPITFDALFAPGTRPLDTIFPLVQQDLETQLGWRAILLPGVGTDPAHYQNFAITDDALIFYFAPGELLLPTAGAASARVARTALPPLTIG